MSTPKVENNLCSKDGPFNRLHLALQQLYDLTFLVLPKNNEDERKSGTQRSRAHGAPGPSPKPQAATERPERQLLCETHLEDQAKGIERGLEMLRRLEPTKQKTRIYEEGMAIPKWREEATGTGSCQVISGCPQARTPRVPGLVRRLLENSGRSVLPGPLPPRWPLNEQRPGTQACGHQRVPSRLCRPSFSGAPAGHKHSRRFREDFLVAK